MQRDGLNGAYGRHGVKGWREIAGIVFGLGERIEIGLTWMSFWSLRYATLLSDRTLLVEWNWKRGRFDTLRYSATGLCLLSRTQSMVTE